MWFYGMKFFWDLAGGVATDETYCSMVFVFYYNIFSLVIGIPFSVYSTFVLEERHGFNKQTVPFYVKDQGSCQVLLHSSCVMRSSSIGWSRYVAGMG